MTLKRTPEQKYISHSNFSVATTNGRQPIAPLFEGVGHEHRQRPLVLQSLTSMSSTQNFGLAASQQDCSVQPLQSPKVAFPRTLGNVLQYKSFFSLYSPQMTSHIIIIWPLFYWCQKIVWIPPKECEIIIWFFLTRHTICLLSIKKIIKEENVKFLIMIWFLTFPGWDRSSIPSQPSSWSVAGFEWRQKPVCRRLVGRTCWKRWRRWWLTSREWRFRVSPFADARSSLNRLVRRIQLLTKVSKLFWVI